jgi:hypothetical protein
MDQKLLEMMYNKCISENGFYVQFYEEMEKRSFYELKFDHKTHETTHEKLSGFYIACDHSWKGDHLANKMFSEMEKLFTREEIMEKLREENIKGQNIFFIICRRYRYSNNELIDLVLPYTDAQSLNKTDKSGKNALLIACSNTLPEYYNGNIWAQQIVKKILSQPHVDLKSCKSALMLACRNGNKEMVEMILEKFNFDLSVLKERNVEGKNAFHLACESKRFEMFTMFLELINSNENDELLNSTTTSGDNCLQVILSNFLSNNSSWIADGKENVIKKVGQILNNPKFKGLNDGNRTAFSLACQTNCKEIVDLFLNRNDLMIQKNIFLLSHGVKPKIIMLIILNLKTNDVIFPDDYYGYPKQSCDLIKQFKMDPEGLKKKLKPKII